MVATNNEPIHEKLKVKKSFMYNNSQHRGIYISMRVCTYIHVHTFFLYFDRIIDRSPNYCSVCVCGGGFSSLSQASAVWSLTPVCVCVCVCERERERERGTSYT